MMGACPRVFDERSRLSDYGFLIRTAMPDLPASASPRAPGIIAVLYFHLAMRSSFANSFRATPRVYTGR